MLNPLPNLDDRRWADLVEEGRTLIPLYAPDWTDHNIHDPGVTILELLASIAEMDIFQLNRVPDRHRRKFLALVGVELQAPVPARTVLRFELTDGSGTMEAPVGTAVAASDADGAAVPFCTTQPLTAVSGRIASVLVRDGRSTEDHTQRFAHGEPVRLLGAAEGAAQELYLGLTEALRSDVWTSFFFRFDGLRSRSVERARIVAEAESQARACSPRPNPCCRDPHPPERSFDLPPHQGARVVWEYRDASGLWISAETQDGTRSLTLDGSVRLKAAGAMSNGGVDSGASDLYYVRARFASGSYDAAPVASRIVLNGVEAEQRTALPTRIDADGNGESDQALSLPRPPVVACSLEVRSLEAGAYYDWESTPDFDSSSRTDRHYTLDAEAGRIGFGDGEHGLAPPVGSTLHASYLTTRADQGNLPEGRAFKLLDAIPDKEKIAKIVNPTPATGGSGAESVSSAAGRALERLRAPQRAVTAADYEVLALETPGTNLARVAVVPNCHPAFDCIEAPGVITVIPVPHLPNRAPQPSWGTLALVARYLNRRRIVGTRVEVIPPQYLKVAVHATVRALPGTSPVMLAQRVSEALDSFLHPLRGGPDRSGWPAGRDVYRSEVMELIDGVSGVDHVVRLELQAGECGPVCGNVCVPSLWLVIAGAHDIRIL